MIYDRIENLPLYEKTLPQLAKIKELIKNSLHKDEIKKARCAWVTFKSRVTIALLKKERIGLAFYFLYVCKEIKRICGKGSPS